MRFIGSPKMADDINLGLPADTRRRIERHIADLADCDQEKSFRAERRLIRFGSKAVEHLIQAAHSPDPQVRFRSVWALGKVGDARAFEAILRLTHDMDERVAYDAILALGELGDLRAVPELRAMVGRFSAESGMAGLPEEALARLLGTIGPSH